MTVTSLYGSKADQTAFYLQKPQNLNQETNFFDPRATDEMTQNFGTVMSLGVSTKSNIGNKDIVVEF